MIALSGSKSKLEAFEWRLIAQLADRFNFIDDIWRIVLSKMILGPHLSDALMSRVTSEGFFNGDHFWGLNDSIHYRKIKVLQPSNCIETAQIIKYMVVLLLIYGRQSATDAGKTALLVSFAQVV